MHDKISDNRPFVSYLMSEGSVIEIPVASEIADLSILLFPTSVSANTSSFGMTPLKFDGTMSLSFPSNEFSCYHSIETVDFHL